MNVTGSLIDRGFRMLNALHRRVVRLSGGRLGARAYGLEMVELVTRGRRTGLAHSTMLLVPLREGDELVVVASKGGDRRDPDWLQNIVADGRVFVTQRGRRRAMTARVATPEERTRYWPRAVGAYPAYEDYQRRAGREIPMVICAPPGPRESIEGGTA